MPLINFRCPDNELHPVAQCLEINGCRMKQRCAPLPYLRAAAFDRKYRGVTPSMAGNGPRYIMLKATTGYSVNPLDRVWAIFGISVHGKLSIHKYTHDVLSEEELEEGARRGIPDVLEQEEGNPDSHILSDYKCFGSFKVAKCLGILKETEQIVDAKGEPIRYKSGKKKGEIKTRQVIKHDPDLADIRGESLQLNRYRIFFNKYGFDIGRLRLFVMVRDGGTVIAYSRGIDQPTYLINVPILPDDDVLSFYRALEKEVEEAMASRYARRCNSEENWGGRRCSPKYCEVWAACSKMSKGEKV